MNSTNVEADKRPKYVVSLKLLGGIILAFIAGYFVHNLLINTNSIDIYSFSTPDLINLILSVLLSGASIVLAISAISLGKFSEQAMTQRSDESIRLQNEVFLKTTDALQRIESSTGVTEKRIEDIISGRVVGDLSQQIARIATESSEKEGALQPKEIEDLIRKTLRNSLEKSEPSLQISNETNQAQLELKKQKEAEDKYIENHKALETQLTKRDDLRALKLGMGSPGKSGYDLFDSVFVNKNGKKIGISDFSETFRPEGFRLVVINSLKELQLNTVDFVQLVIYQPKESFEKIYKEIESITSAELKTKIALSIAHPEQIEDFVKSLPIE